MLNIAFRVWIMTVSLVASSWASTGRDTFDPQRLQSLNPQLQKLLRPKIDHWLQSENKPEMARSLRKMTRSYSKKGSKEEVIRAYLHQHPDQAWRRGPVRYLLSYSKVHERWYYPDEPAPEFHVGLVIWNALHFSGPKLVVGVEITKLQADQHSALFELAYLPGNVSEGVQRLTFVQTSPNQTKVVHESWYHSDSKFRDRWIYPMFHSLTTGAFHRQVTVQ